METPAWMRDATRVAVLTGAGISTASGIPDYRGPEGVWTRDPAAAAAFTLDAFARDRDLRVQFWKTYLDHAAWAARPNDAHHALARLDGAGVAVRVLTQNIDGLHQMTGLPARKVLELHGTMWTTSCIRCRARVSTNDVRTRVAAGEDDPRCIGCGGVLKVDAVLFGERLNPEVMGNAVSIASATPLFLAVGSSLVVEPAAQLCRVAVDRGAQLVIVNRDPTPYDGLAVEVVHTDIVDTLPGMVDQLIDVNRRRPALA